MAAAAQVAAKMQASGIGKSEHLFFCFISTMNIYNSISCIDLFQDEIITQLVSHKEIPFANEIPSVYIPFAGMTQSLHLAVFAFNTSSNFSWDSCNSKGTPFLLFKDCAQHSNGML